MTATLSSLPLLTLRDRLQLHWTGTVWRCSYERGTMYEADYQAAMVIGNDGESADEVCRNAIFRAQLTETK